MNWYFDGSNLNNNKPLEEQNQEMARNLKMIYDSFISVGFSKAETMQLLVAIVQGACKGVKK